MKSYGYCLDDQGGQQISVRKDGKAPTLRAEAHGNVPCVFAFEPGAATRLGGYINEDITGTLRAEMGDNQISVAYAVENHPNDSRVRIDDSGKVQTLTSRCGTGGGNVPIVMFSKVKRAQSNEDYETWGDTGVSNTLNNFDNGDVRTNECVICTETQQGGADLIVGGGGDMTHDYIVRRLTPLECSRLQGFPDGWAEIDHKEDFTDEEYEFWLDVRNTFAEINGKQVKDYTKEQMLKWYNKLHTDSAEYKMWGNGIGLPNAYYVMEGIADLVRNESNAR